MTTTVVNVRDPLGPGDILLRTYIGRPSRFGNPFRVDLMVGTPGSRARYEEHERVVNLYRQYLRAHPDIVMKARRELKGKILVCFCKPLPCHGDVLAEVAEGRDP